jgi:hypothetical protein
LAFFRCRAKTAINSSSYDNIRIWDLNYIPPDIAAEPTADVDTPLGSALVPFSIIAGHHGGVISSVCK